MPVTLCTGATFVKKNSYLVARIVSFGTSGLHLLTLRILVELQDLTIVDILAEEFMYHTSCYRNICRIEKQVVNPEEIQEKRVREECIWYFRSVSIYPPYFRVIPVQKY